MPRNRNALARIKIIDSCLQRSGISWDWEKLARECWEKLDAFIDEPPSRETIMGDISFMRKSWGAPIVYDRARKSYMYADSSYSIFQNPLSREDVQNLQFALEVIRQFKGFQKLEGIEDIITKLEHLILMVDSVQHPIVQFEHSLNEMGQRWLDILFGLVRDRTVIKIIYEPFQEPAREITVSPYLLKEYNNRWFLLGQDHGIKQLQIYSLDRIHGIEKLLMRFIPNKVLDPATYFNDLIGVTRFANRRKLKIRFKVSQTSSPYIRTKPIHESQTLEKESKDFDIYSITVIPNIELEARLLSYGDWLTVLGPTSFVKRMKSRAAVMYENYH